MALHRVRTTSRPGRKARSPDRTASHRDRKARNLDRTTSHRDRNARSHPRRTPRHRRKARSPDRTTSHRGRKARSHPWTTPRHSRWRQACDLWWAASDAVPSVVKETEHGPSRDKARRHSERDGCAGFATASRKGSPGPAACLPPLAEGGVMEGKLTVDPRRAARIHGQIRVSGQHPLQPGDSDRPNGPRRRSRPSAHAPGDGPHARSGGGQRRAMPGPSPRSGRWGRFRPPRARRAGTGTSRSAPSPCASAPGAGG